jgi:hypothetical protein
MKLVTLKFGVSKIMFKPFKDQRFCNKYNLKTKNISEEKTKTRAFNLI